MAWWRSGHGVGLRLRRSRARLPALRFQVTTLGKLFTHVFLCHNTHIHTHTHQFNGPFLRDYPGEPVPERKIPIWILQKQETVSGGGINWAICKSAPRSRQITTPAPHRSDFYRPDALSAAQPTASKQSQSSITWGC